MSGTGAIRNLLIDGNKTITVIFSPATYTVTADVIGNGQITIEPQKSSYDYGEVVTVTATPDPGWSFDTWLTGLQGVTATQTLLIDSDKNILALFSEVDYTLSVSWEGEGEVNLTPAKVSYQYGEVVTVTATAASNYEFSGWSGDLSGNTLTETLTMDGNKNIVANFVQIPVTLTLNVVGHGAVTLLVDGETLTPTGVFTGVFGLGTTVLHSATADADWTFSGWSGDVVSTTNPISITLDSDKVITATFTTINDAPVLDPLADQNVDESDTVSFTATASDTDVPTQTLTLSLSDQPSEASPDTGSGTSSVRASR